MSQDFKWTLGLIALALALLMCSMHYGSGM